MSRAYPFLLILGLLWRGPLFAQDRDVLVRAFDAAGAEFSVPPDILKSISFEQTRWFHLTWAEGDTASCVGMPHPYGIMALWDTEMFGSTLREAARLVDLPEEVLKNDPIQNIRGAAALLREAFETSQRKSPEPLDPASLDAWTDAIAAYSGISQPEIAYAHAMEVLHRLSVGHEDDFVLVPKRTVRLDRVRTRLSEIETERHTEAARVQDTQVPDYPQATWVPGVSGYYYTSGNGKQFVVIHDMEGYYASVISYFQHLSDGRTVSIHYCVNGLQDSPSDYPPGDITQMVEERYYAWHAVCLNRWSLGIEHEGFAANPQWFTPDMYIASAGLVRHMCDKFGIPKDRNHIIGHGEYLNPNWVNWVNQNGFPSEFATCNNHYDPGSFWDWDFYLQLIREDKTPPTVVSQPPAGPINVDARVEVWFDQRMDPATVTSALSISPSVAVNLSWEEIGRTLRIKPAAQLPFNTQFTVTIDTTAKNYLGVGLDLDGDSLDGDVYSFSFTTVAQDTVPPVIVDLYPRDSDASVPLTAQFMVTFTESIDAASLPGSFSLVTSGGVPFTLTGITYTREDDISVVRFRTTSELFANTQFTLTVNPTITDLAGNPVPQGRTVSFRTEPRYTVTGTVINTVDATGSWWQPSTSGSTRNVLATFAIVTDQKHSGTGSGRINYTFTQPSGGIIREHNSSTPDIEGAPLLGVWVFGDNSGHDLRYLLYTSGAAAGYVIESMGPIDWIGWKLRTIPMSSVPPGNGTARRFSSIMVYQNPGGPLSGTLYFDDLSLISSVTDVASFDQAGIPVSWRIGQNFPNPFNPTTTIEYDVPVEGQVRLTVWNGIGQRVALLVDGKKTAGRYRETFDASALPSGIYIARLEGGTNTVSMKMMLLK